MKKFNPSLLAISLLSSVFAHADSYTCRSGDGKAQLSFTGRFAPYSDRLPEEIRIEVIQAEKDRVYAAGWQHESSAVTDATFHVEVAVPTHGTFAVRGSLAKADGKEIRRGFYGFAVEQPLVDGRATQEATGVLELDLPGKRKDVERVQIHCDVTQDAL